MHLLVNARLQHYEKECLLSYVEAVYTFIPFVSAGFLYAPPGLLLQDDELQDEFGGPRRPLHHHGVSAVLQQVHSAAGQHLCNDRGSGDVHHLGQTQRSPCVRAHAIQNPGAGRRQVAEFVLHGIVF